MINVALHKTGGKFSGFKIEGHSGYGEAGTDIVCASVSILSYTALNSMNEVAGLPLSDIQYEVDEETGFLKLSTDNNNEKTEIIYRNFLVGISLLLEDYSDYITLKLEEV
jgi:uncharacterized protein YsxB (DUF464 family)